MLCVIVSLLDMLLLVIQILVKTADSILTWQLDPEEIEIEHVQLNERVIAACRL